MLFAPTVSAAAESAGPEAAGSRDVRSMGEEFPGRNPFIHV
jgi:hypothetical protein